MTFALLAAVTVLAVGGCGSGDNDTSTKSTTQRTSATSGPSSTGTTTVSSGTSAPAGQQTISIQSFKFNPTPLPTKAGKITVVNLDDGVPHSLTADDNSFDTGVFKKENGAKTITVSKTTTYHCEVHKFMTGSIQVR